MLKMLDKVSRFLKMADVDRKSIYLILLFGPISSCAVPYVHIYFYAKILDCMLAGQLEPAVQNMLWLVGLTFVCGLTTKICWNSLEVACAACGENVKQRTADKAFRMDYEAYEKKETLDGIRRVRGNWRADIGRQLMSIYHFIEMGLYTLTALVFMLVFFFRIDYDDRNFFTSWKGIPVLLLFSFLLLLAGKKVSGRIGEKNKEMLEHGEKQNALRVYFMSFAHTLESAMDIRIFQLQRLIEKKSEETCKVEDDAWEYGKQISALEALFSFVSGIGVLFTYVLIVGKAYYGIISVGDILLYVGMINSFFQYLSRWINSYNWVCSRLDYVLTYEEFLEQQELREPVSELCEEDRRAMEKPADGRWELELQNVSFAYPGNERDSLKHINLKIRSGEKLALVGPNGAGKTTLIKLLCRLYQPGEGKILLNGQDISRFAFAEYTSVFSVVFQDFELLAFSVRDNILAGQDEGAETAGLKSVDSKALRKEERIWKVLEMVEMDERVRQMPQGLDSLLFKDNGDGTMLSGGEAQKLAIARALYKDAPFVILDEPAAALDPIAEAQIYENFDKLIQGKTSVYISHRMSSCQFCDRIVVLDQGAVVEEGTHAQLMEREGLYARLYRAQAKHYA